VFYTARIRIDEDQRGLLKLIPGCGGGLHRTGEAHPLSYLVKPVTDHSQEPSGKISQPGRAGGLATRGFRPA